MTTGTDVDDQPPVETAPSGSRTAVGPTPGFDRSTRYRYLIPLVTQLDGPVTIDQLVDPMLHWEHELAASDSGKAWADVHEELFVVDLPVLDRVGLVEFDADSGLISTDRRA